MEANTAHLSSIRTNESCSTNLEDFPDLDFLQPLDTSITEPSGFNDNVPSMVLGNPSNLDFSTMDLPHEISQSQGTANNNIDQLQSFRSVNSPGDILADPFAGFFFGSTLFPTSGAMVQSGASLWDSPTIEPSVSPKSAATVPSNMGYLHQISNQELVSDSVLNDLSMQPSVTVIPYKEFGNQQNPPIPTSASQDRGKSGPKNGTSRKRRRSSNPSTNQRLSTTTRKGVNVAGVPQEFLGTMCFGTETAPKRKRTYSQKQNRISVENANGACHRCFLLKLRV